MTATRLFRSLFFIVCIDSTDNELLASPRAFDENKTKIRARRDEVAGPQSLAR